jgi:hypothetical protein
MKENFYEYYQKIIVIRESIETRIKNEDVKDYLELVIQNNFLESQKV